MNRHIHPLFREILRSVSEPTEMSMCPSCMGDLSEPCEECGSRGYLTDDDRTAYDKEREV